MALDQPLKSKSQNNKISMAKISQAQVLRAYQFWLRRQEWIRYRFLPTGWPPIRKEPFPRDLELEVIAFAAGISDGTLRKLDRAFYNHRNDEAGFKRAVKASYPLRSRVLGGLPIQFWVRGESQKVKLPGSPPKLWP
jgi:hypothetical protein